VQGEKEEEIGENYVVRSFITYTPLPVLLQWQNKEERARENKHKIGFGGEICGGNISLENLDIDATISHVKFI
jgi:hypothetical protein